MADLTPEMVVGLLRRYYEKCLSVAEEHAYIAPMDPQLDISAEIAGYEAEQANLRDRIGGRKYSAMVIHDAESLFSEAGLPIPARVSQTFDTVCNGVLRATVEQRRVLVALLKGDMQATVPVDPLFSGIVPNGDYPPVPGDTAVRPKSVRAIADRYQSIKVQGKEWVGKTEGENRRVLALFCDLIDGSKALTAVTDDDVRRYRDALLVVPPNFSKFKEFEGKTFPQVVAFCTASASYSGLSPKTARKYVENLHSFLNWCTSEGYLTRHPGQKIKITAKVNEKEARLPFSDAQLETIFHAPLYTGQKSISRRNEPGDLIIKDDRYWVPLVGLFSGMRLGEIVQLLVTDIRDAGACSYFDIARGENEDKQLKSDAAVRRVPVHPTLIQLGFLQFVADRRSASPTGRVFEDFPKGPDGYFSHHPSKWFGRFVTTIGAKTPKTAFHSFRHNFKDALVAGDVEISRRLALMGHADDNTHSNYGSGLSLKQLDEAVKQVGFTLDLSHLMPKSK